MNKESSTPTLNEKFCEAIQNCQRWQDNIITKERGWATDEDKAANACEKIALSFALNCQIELLKNMHDYYFHGSKNVFERELKNGIESLTKQLNELK